MLRQRVLTALIIAPPTLAALIFLPSVPFALLTGLIICIAGWEWANLAELKGLMVVFYLLVLVAGMTGVYATDGLGVSLVLWIAIPVWVINLAILMGYPETNRYLRWAGTRSVMGLIMLIPAWWALIVLADLEHRTYLILLLLFIVWSADIGAYFSGRAWGKAKLAPKVSPGKTWEGVYGGLVASLLIAWSFSLLVGLLDASRLSDWLIFAALALITATISVLGDLTESMFKRYRGIKDSSQLLPGHGGVLDRIDSLIAALPVFTLMSIYLNL